MKSYITWILCFSISFWSAFTAYDASLWWLRIISAVFWIIGFCGFYFTDHSNRARYSILDKALRREKKNAAKERSETNKEIGNLQNELSKEKTKKNIFPGSRPNTEELKKRLILEIRGKENM